MICFGGKLNLDCVLFWGRFVCSLPQSSRFPIQGCFHFTDKETEALERKKSSLWRSSEVGGLSSLRQVGTGNPLRQNFHLDKRLLEQQNTKRYKGLKSAACMHRWSKFWTTRFTKTKTPTAMSEATLFFSRSVLSDSL